MGFEEAKDYIDIIEAKKDGQSIVIVDENDNQDFSDDPVRPSATLTFGTTRASRFLSPGRKVIEVSGILPGLEWARRTSWKT